MPIKRTALFALMLGVPSCHAFAQGPDGGNYPSRLVRVITPFASGGGGDFVARALAKILAETWGQPVVVDARPGASNILATDLAAKSAPDGYTLLMVGATFSVNPVLQTKLPYDTLKDLAPVTQTSFLPYVLVVYPALPVRTVQELVAYARATPGALNYGAAGTQNQLAIELLKLRTEVSIVHVAYRGAALAITDLIGGQIQLALGSTLAVAPDVNAGRLRSLAVTSGRRASSMPGVPTIAEAAGLPGYDVSAWNGVVVPAGVPESVVARLNADIVNALKSPELRDKLAAEGGEIVGNTAAEFARFIRAEIATWAKVVKAANLRAER
jgi:tripartite-type tricarboxylate transporter receptor subunit TctC